jgi:uncharacterized membrane protein YciS (DUF1049 family)
MLKWIKRLIIIVLFVVAIVLSVTFTSENSQLTSLVFFGYSLPELQLGLWVLIVLFIGALVGLMLSFIPLLWGKQTLASKDRKIRQLEKELNQIRTASLKG